MTAIVSYAPWVALTLAIWLSQWAFRRKWPQLWDRFSELGPLGEPLRMAWQSLPSVMAGALVAAAQSGGDPKVAALGALSGVAAPVLHHIAKWSPLPYSGK